MFEKLCVAGAELNDPLTAFHDIDRVLAACERYKRPVYLEVPRDMVHVRPEGAPPYEQPVVQSDQGALAEAIEEAARRIDAAERPVFLLGVEVHRFGLQDTVLQLAEAANIPLAATMLGKGVVAETHPLYMGLYEGALGPEAVTKYVETSDCVVMLGTFMTDINLGIYTAKLDVADCVYATSEELRIRHHHYHDVRLEDFLEGLVAWKLKTHAKVPTELTNWRQQPFELQASEPITISRLIERLDEQLNEETIVVADIGDALFASTELTTRGRTEFLSPAYYTSMGFSVPAALGAQVARPQARVVAIVGDGAFQMTGMELSNLVRHKMPVIVIVLNNGGYGTERLLHPGEYEFNEVHSWHYDQLPAVLGGGTGYVVQTEGDFDTMLTAAWNDYNRAQYFARTSC